MPTDNKVHQSNRKGGVITWPGLATEKDLQLDVTNVGSMGLYWSYRSSISTEVMGVAVAGPADRLFWSLGSLDPCQSKIC